MPIVDWDQESTWWLNYTEAVRDPESPRHGEMVTYGREWAKKFWDPRGDTPPRKWVKRMDTLRNVVSKDRILVVGCAFGFLLERFLDDGFTEVWGTDTSDWIHSNLQEARDDIRDRIFKKDPQDSDAGQFFKDKTGQARFTWVITEEVLSSYEDDELTPILNGCEDLVKGNRPDRVVHIADTPGTSNPTYNLKTPEEWEAIRPDHTWVTMPGHEVV